MLLRRRKKTFDQWITEAGISSYGEVVKWCDRIGVVAPQRQEFDALRPEIVSVPTHGVVVVEVGGHEAAPIEAPQPTEKQKKKRRQPPAASVVTDQQD